MTAADLAYLTRLAGFTIEGPAWPRCESCGQTECFGPDGHDVPVSDVAAWVLGHTCRKDPARAPLAEVAA
jgi:hypothetical protein